MKDLKNICVRLSKKDRDFLKNYMISPTKLVRDAIRKEKLKIKKQSKKTITIKDWAGNILYNGPYSSPEVDRVLEANRCECYDRDLENCKNCEDSGYRGDFEIFWDDENNTSNVYEFINY